MLMNNMFSNTKLLEKALDASLMRNEVIANNISNVDTPGYKKKAVRFEELLHSAMGNGQVLNVDGIDPEVYTDNANLSYRSDGNNVDIDTEMADMAKNTIKYNVLIARMNGKFNSIKTVLRGG
ncbi:MAG TPA: flagellar basal body rod protein FlgB [Clostridiales bacterium]|nr:MAG: flagellar basal-body rod protein FlgB [Clostridiales bacterium GWD2_32_19]HCC07614.1 flagellar basal body rod protein FlgB [Clostridiales bacterium]